MPVLGIWPGPGEAAFLFFKVPDLDAGLEAGLGLDLPETITKTIIIYVTQLNSMVYNCNSVV